MTFLYKKTLLSLQLFTVLIVFLSCVPLISKAFAADYYVSSAGNDSDPGTISQPWQTITKVNTITFTPGDRILFRGGDTFSGNIFFDTPSEGTSVNPITVTSYGTGRATISAGNSFGIFAYDNGGFHITTINFVGSGIATNTNDGLSFYNDLAGNVKKPHIYIDNVDISGFRNYGIAIGGDNGTSGYNDVRIVNVSSHDNGKTGINIYALTPNSNTNVYVGYSSAYNNTGIVGDTNPSGNGIALGGVDTGTVEYSEAYNNGAANTNPEGPVGIWAYDSTNITLQYNESYENKTNSGGDGGGFDFDQNTSNSTMQYNYSHGNAGAGYLLAHSLANDNHTGNIVRYNISENDGRKNNAAGITIWGRIRNTEIYNNTVYITPPSAGIAKAIYIFNDSITTQFVSSLHIRNNILYTTSTARLLEVTTQELSGATDLLFQGNNYYSTGTFRIDWGGTTYNSLAAWRSATSQEKVSGSDVGLSTDPLLTSAGNGGTSGDPTNRTMPSAYKLQSSSPMINAGLNLSSLFSLSMGSNDYYRGSIPYDTQFDIGAHEYAPLITSSSNSGGANPPSCSSSVPTSAPRLFQINASAHNATLYFSPASNAGKHYIAYGYSPQDLRFGIEISSGTSTGSIAYTVNHLSPNTKYYFMVRGGNGCATGGWSNTLYTTTTSSDTINTIETAWNQIREVTESWLRT